MCCFFFPLPTTSPSLSPSPSQTETKDRKKGHTCCCRKEGKEHGSCSFNLNLPSIFEVQVSSTLIHFLNTYLIPDVVCGLFLASSTQVSLFEANFILRGVVNNLDRQNGGVSGGDSRNGHRADRSIPDCRSISFLLRPLNHRRRRPIFRRHRRRPREEERQRGAKIEIGYPLDPQLCFFNGSRKVTCFVAHSELV